MMEIKQLTGEDALAEFNAIRPWLEVVLEKSAGYTTIGDVWRMLAEGRANLILGYNGYIVGFAFTEVLHTAHGPWVNIPFAYCETELDYDSFFSEVSKIANKNGMCGVKFISYRPGFQKLADKHDWKVGYTEYIVSDFRGGK